MSNFGLAEAIRSRSASVGPWYSGIVRVAAGAKIARTWSGSSPTTRNPCGWVAGTNPVCPQSAGAVAGPRTASSPRWGRRTVRSVGACEGYVRRSAERLSRWRWGHRPSKYRPPRYWRLPRETGNVHSILRRSCIVQFLTGYISDR